jgi:hypothetical protein
MKKKTIIIIAVFALLCTAFSIIAFAGETPIIPICSHRNKTEIVETQPTCTTAGVAKKQCTKCNKVLSTYSVPALGHKFCYSGVQTQEGAKLDCEYCDETEYYLPAQLEDMWDVSFVNKAPVRSLTDTSAYLDLNGDGIINAKDYAIICKLDN